MTIIQPHKRQFNIRLAILIALFIAVVFMNISVYNAIVDMRYALKTQEKSLKTLEVANAELKNKLYGLLDVGNASLVAEKLSLVKERRPEYLYVPIAIKQ